MSPEVVHPLRGFEVSSREMQIHEQKIYSLSGTDGAKWSIDSTDDIGINSSSITRGENSRAESTVQKIPSDHFAHSLN